jgi:hypothetical protein
LDRDGSTTVCGRNVQLPPRLKSGELDGDARLSEANFVNGPKRLPIRYAFA